MPFLAVDSRDSDCPSVQPSQLPDRAQVMQGTDVDSDEEPSAARPDSSAVVRAVAERRLQLQNLRREMP